MAEKSKLKSNQILVIGLVLLVIGAIGWYIVQSRSQSSTSSSPSSTLSTATSVQSTTASSQPPANCTKVESKGQAVFMTLNSTGPANACVQVTSDVTLAVNNATNQTITATLGSQTVTANAGIGASFTGAAGTILTPGKNVMDVSLYGADQDPVIWLTQ